MINKHGHEMKVIALTGGACSGKTTMLDKLVEKGELDGYRLLFVPEAATMIATHGMHFSDGEKMYQRAILSIQIALENAFIAYANELDQDVCIICDRGTLDGAAYCGDSVFADLCDEQGVSRADLLDCYDGVLYLVSAAIGAPDHYTCENNPARRETLEEAAELEARTIKCWSDHNGIMIIDNEGGKSFDEKMDEALSALRGFLTSGR